jgi:anti-sigma factor RsiW
MPIQCDFNFSRYEDGVLSISMRPPVSIGAWNLLFSLSKRFGGEPTINKYAASGFSNVSGIAVVNSGQGTFSVTINSVDTSGLEYGNYAFQAIRTDSGSRTVLSEGYLVLTP